MLSRLLTWSVAAVCCLPLQGALAVPAGGQVVAGNAAINSTRPGAIQVQQISDSAVIDWQSFSLSASERVQFSVPNQGITLNRVLGNQASQINGQISSNGTLFFVNPNGLFFGKQASVSAEKLLLATGNIANDDFMQGRYAFSHGQADIVNEGQLNGKTWVSLIAPSIHNLGNIESTGQVNLISASDYTLNYADGSLFSFSVPKDAVNAIIDNSGSLKGGQVQLNAKAIYALNNQVINTTGIIQATSASVNALGEVVLRADDQHSVLVESAISADAIEITGQTVVLGNQAKLSAPGGRVKVGGDWHGQGNLLAADKVLVAPNAVIDVSSATQAGEVVIWSQQQTLFYGHIQAQGGQQGGQVEVSSKGTLQFAGLVDLSGALAGSLLLDPNNITITNLGTKADLIGTTNDDSNVQTYSFNEDGLNDSTIKASTLVALLETGNVELQANGDITVDEAIDASANTNTNGLTLTAYGDLLINQNITTHNGAITLNAGDNNVATGNNLGIVMANGTSLNAGNAAIQLTGTDGNLNLASLNTTGTVTLSTPGRITDTLIAANILNIRAANQIGTSAASRLQIQASQLSIESATNNPIAVNGTFLQEQGNSDVTIRSLGNLDYASDAELTATHIQTDANTSTISLAATKIVAKNVVSNTGAITLTTPSLDLTNLTTGSNTAAVTVNNAAINVLANNAIQASALNLNNTQGTQTNTLKTQIDTLNLSGTSGTHQIQNNQAWGITGTDGGNASLSNTLGNVTFGSGSAFVSNQLTVASAGKLLGDVQANSLRINNVGGVGTDSNNRFNTTLGSLTVNDTSATSGLFINETDNLTLTAITTNNAFDLQTNTTSGVLQVNNIAASSANLKAKQITLNNTSALTLNTQVDVVDFANNSGTVSLVNAQALTATGSHTGTVNLETLAGNLVLGSADASTTLTNGDLTVKSAGTLSGFSTANTLNIQKVAGLGSNSQAFKTDVNTLNIANANAAISTGDIYINELANSQVTLRSTDGNLVLNHAGTLTHKQIDVGAQNITLSGGAIAQTGASALVANNLTITSASSIGTSAQPLKTNVANLTLSNGGTPLNSGSVFIAETDNLTLAEVLLNNANFSLSAGGNLVTNRFEIGSGNASFAITGSLTDTGSQSFIANQLTLSKVAQLGSLANPFNVNLSSLTLDNIGLVNMTAASYLNELNSLTLNKVTQNQDFNLTAGGQVAVGLLNVGATNNVALSTTGAVIATNSLTSQSLISANQLTFSAVQGVGTDVALNTEVNQVLFGTGAAMNTGNINIKEQTGLSGFSVHSQDGQVTLQTGGDATVSIVTQNNPITVSANNSATLTLNKLQIQDATPNVVDTQITLANASLVDDNLNRIVANKLVLNNVQTIGSAGNALNVTTDELTLNNAQAGFIENNQAWLISGSVQGDQTFYTGGAQTRLNNFTQTAGSLVVNDSPSVLELNKVVLQGGAFTGSANKISVLDYSNLAATTSLNSSADIEIGTLNALGQTLNLTAGANIKALANNQLTADTLNISAANLVGQANQRLNVGLNTLNMNTAGGQLATTDTAYLNATQSVNLNNINLAKGLDLLAAGQTLSLTKLHTANANVVLDAAAIAQTDLNVGSGQVTFKSASLSQQGNTRGIAGQMQFDQVLTVGTSATPFLVSTPLASVVSNRAVYLDNNQTLNLTNVATPTAFTLVNAGDLSLTNMDVTNDINLQVSGALALGRVASTNGNVLLNVTGAITDQNTAINTDLDLSGINLWVQQANGIGLANDPLDIAFNTLDVQTASNTLASTGAIYLQESNDLTLRTLTMNNDLQVTLAGNLLLDQVNLAAANAVFSATGRIDNLSDNAHLTAGELLLTSAQSVGSLASPLKTSINTLNIHQNNGVANVGSVWISETDAIDLVQIKTDSNALNLQAGGNITTQNVDVAGGNLTFRTTGSLNNQAAVAVVANDLLIEAAKGVGTAAQPFNVQVANLNLHNNNALASLGNVYIKEVDSLTLQTVNIDGELFVETAGNLTLNSVSLANKNLTVKALGNVISQNVNLGSGNAIFNLGGSLSDQSNSLLVANDLTLYSAKGVGSNSNAFTVNLNTLNLHNNLAQVALGAAYFDEADSVALVNANLANAIQLTAGADLTVTQLDTHNQSVELAAGNNLTINAINTGSQTNGASVILTVGGDITNVGTGIVTQVLDIKGANNVGLVDSLDNAQNKRLVTQVQDLKLSQVTGNVYLSEQDSFTITDWQSASDTLTTADLVVAGDLTLHTVDATKQNHQYVSNQFNALNNYKLAGGALVVTANNQVNLDANQLGGALYQFEASEGIEFKTAQVNSAMNLATNKNLTLKKDGLVIIKAADSSWQAGTHEVNYVLNALTDQTATFEINVANLTLSENAVISEPNHLFKTVNVVSSQKLDSAIAQLSAGTINFDLNIFSGVNALTLQTATASSVKVNDWTLDGALVANQDLTMQVANKGQFNQDVSVQGAFTYASPNAITGLKASVYAERIDMNSQFYLQSDKTVLSTSPDALPADSLLKLDAMGGEIQLDGSVDSAAGYPLGSMRIYAGKSDVILNADFGLKSIVYLLDVTTQGQQLGTGRKVLTLTSLNGLSIKTNHAADLVQAAESNAQLITPDAVLKAHKEHNANQVMLEGQSIKELGFANRSDVSTAAFSLDAYASEWISSSALMFDFGQSINLYMFME